MVLTSGCAAFRNPAAVEPPRSFSDRFDEWLPCAVGVRPLDPEEFLPFEREIAHRMSMREADRLIEILKHCRIFESVLPAGPDDDAYDVILEPLPRTMHRTGSEDPWLLLSGGVIPFYSKEDRGIRFRIAKGGAGEFAFEWIESTVLGFWAPFVGILGVDWSLRRGDGAYWFELRSSLERRFAGGPLRPRRAVE
jgi:hypothetical protein